MELSAEWIVERNEDFDLYVYGREVMETAIECFKNDDELQAAAFVINKKEIHCVVMSFSGTVEKASWFSALTKYAQNIEAIAIVTLNDIYYGNPEDAEDYYPGKLKDIGAKESVMVTITGPGLKNWIHRTPYERKNGQLIFQLPTEEFGGHVEFLKDWADNIKSVN